MSQRLDLPEFRIEAYFERWEFNARYHLTASDPESMTVSELLALGTDADRAALDGLWLGYTPTWGTDALRSAIAATYSRVPADDVLVFTGAEEALFWTLQVLLGPGEHAVVTVPNYQSTETVPLAAGSSLTGVPLWTGSGSTLDWTLDLDRVKAALRPNTTVVAVNFPNNPTGYVPSLSTFQELVALCESRGIRLVSDEVYRGIELDASRTLPQAADLSERAVSINVLSKAYGLPGLRIGWVACCDKAALRALERAKEFTTICNSAPSELLATVAMRNAPMLRERVRGIVAANVPVFTDFFAKHADRFEFTPPDGSCVAFPRYLGPEGVEEFCRRAVEERGLLFLPASIFASDLAEVPGDRFRVGLGRLNPQPGLEVLDDFLSTSPPR
ncbi:aminotransferase class I/II-fold pyridoxal phosphate-dependent enzyme [Tenggerimyces flavus]|uniref:Aminotransferase class I/II-fold pyridoxal phosphate-dependent enzyme n=1 Tax=Tenggerimyces flavus TaxID=1708749 RepID=A0ABV7YIN1_9ACTN|nr:pyridoxal phosphate-dependent aminotransferase [Tenggerimyces flavus]MBM7789199.1 aspartate/methionine/tyrosine aminotransferase [Tenggerimyces flavus]